MTETVTEFRGAFHDVMVITELRGSYPNVPISADVDYAALIAGDDNPTFITLPIGKAGVTSGNNRHYDEAFVIELERQTLANKPVGLMGHLSETDRATAFPQEAVHWVGALREGATLWGKGYIPPGPIRDRIAKYKATGKAIATSIDAFAEGIYDEGLKAMRMVAKSLRLNQIDIAPADRAGIPDLAAVPHFTTEMDAAPDIAQEDSVSTEQVIQELRKAKVTPLRGWTQTAPAEDVSDLAAIREALGVGEDADLVQSITEMRRTQKEQAQKAIVDRIRELATTGDKAIKVEAARGLVMELVAARNPQSIQEADAAYEQVSSSDGVKRLLAAEVRERMGPPQGGGSVAGQQGRNKYFQIPVEGGA